MIGAIVGDIVGSIYEFSNIKTKNFPFFGKGCEYTDDSILTVAIADAIMHSDEDLESFRNNARLYLRIYARRYPHPMGGYGGRFAYWANSCEMEPYNSCGNGSAMRVSPCAFMAKNFDEAVEFARASAEVTHNHPEGIKGAEATAAAIYLARSKYDKNDIRNFIGKYYYSEIMDMSLDEIRPFYHFESTCQRTVPQALQAFFESTDFEDAIRNGISIGGDSDTLCAITGAVAEAYYGVPKEIRSTAMAYLPEEIATVVRIFESKYEN